MALEIKENVKKFSTEYSSVRSGILQLVINDFFQEQLFESIVLDTLQISLTSFIEEQVGFYFKINLDRDEILTDMNMVRGTVFFEDGPRGKEQKTLLFTVEPRGMHYNESSIRL